MGSSKAKFRKKALPSTTPPHTPALHDFNAALTWFYVIITLISWKICAQMLYSM
jgi:hypothetical protein